MLNDQFGLLMLPFFMIAIGFIYSFAQPKTINWIYGYRTFRAMKSQEAWEFANKYCAKLFVLSGLIVLVISVIILFTFRNDTESLKDLSDTIVLGQLISIIGGTIIPTEIQLRKRFDKDGNPTNN